MSDPQDAARFLLARERHSGLDNVGFLPLNGPMDVWISIMYLFLCGQSFMPHEIADALINHCAQAAREDGLQPGLTTREWEVLHMVAQGAANKNIAADLDLSIHTVKLHIHNLLRKIGVSNRTCAASWFMEHHSGQPDPHRGAHGGS
ncbi:response regulator transcription factor [Pseudorhodobacter turbinis]|uniref:Response regulator transcription factor n=2 Tax=Pseudorhodobacter turbinis TaxID=2500533 RepID=A0A4P8EH06_9RHOB|nr:response regulator transcription factor [Pseudorhodobacter turbinis]